MSAALRGAWPAALVTLGAAGLAALWFFTDLEWIAGLALGFGIILGSIQHVRGRKSLGKDPVQGRRLYEFRLLWVLLLVLLVAAAVLIVGVAIPEYENEPEKKAVIPGSIGAITAFLTAVLVDPFKKGGTDYFVGEPFRKVLQKEFGSRFAEWTDETGKRADLAVNDDDWPPSPGWGRSARRTRAEAVAKALGRA